RRTRTRTASPIRRTLAPTRRSGPRSTRAAARRTRTRTACTTGLTSAPTRRPAPPWTRAAVPPTRTQTACRTASISAPTRRPGCRSTRRAAPSTRTATACPTASIRAPTPPPARRWTRADARRLPTRTAGRLESGRERLHHPVPTGNRAGRTGRRAGAAHVDPARGELRVGPVRPHARFLRGARPGGGVPARQPGHPDRDRRLHGQHGVGASQRAAL